MIKRTCLVTAIRDNISANQKKFLAEVIGTFIVVVLATGSVVIDAKLNGALGTPFAAFAPFVGVAIGVYLFGKVSMAHFNPAVTLGFLITKHITKRLAVLYITAEIAGALLGSIFVKYMIGSEAFLGASSPNYAYPLPLIFGVEILASALLMAVILVEVYKKGLMGLDDRYWRNCWLGDVLFGIHIRCVNEHRMFVGNLLECLECSESVALLDSHICRHIYNCNII